MPVRRDIMTHMTQTKTFLILKHGTMAKAVDVWMIGEDDEVDRFTEEEQQFIKLYIARNGIYKIQRSKA